MLRPFSEPRLPLNERGAKEIIFLLGRTLDSTSGPDGWGTRHACLNQPFLPRPALACPALFEASPALPCTAPLPRPSLICSSLSCPSLPRPAEPCLTEVMYFSLSLQRPSFSACPAVLRMSNGTDPDRFLSVCFSGGFVDAEGILRTARGGVRGC